MRSALSEGAVVTSYRRPEEYERLAARHPEDRQALLLEAAEAWQGVGEHDRALALYDRLLDRDQEGGGCDEPDLVDAFRINALWDAGRDDEALAAAMAFRGRHPRQPAAWNFVGEAFESHEKDAAAAEWYTAGIAHVLGGRSMVSVSVLADVVEAADESADGSEDDLGLETLFIARHRARRLSGAPHDDWDRVADELHARRQIGLVDRPHTLDEAHDPTRLRRLRHGGHEVLEAEIKELAAAIAEGRQARTVGVRTCVLYWDAEEFAKLVRRRPQTTKIYGDDHAAHLRKVEKILQELADGGGVHLAVGHATLAGLEAHIRQHGGTPEAQDTRSAYAAELARRGEVTDWPPHRNDPCWCGSGDKYKKCCGNPAVV